MPSTREGRRLCVFRFASWEIMFGDMSMPLAPVKSAVRFGEKDRLDTIDSMSSSQLMQQRGRVYLYANDGMSTCCKSKSRSDPRAEEPSILRTLPAYSKVRASYLRLLYLLDADRLGSMGSSFHHSFFINSPIKAIITTSSVRED